MVTVTISGAEKSGALFKITTFLNRKGYPLIGHELAESGSGGKVLRMNLDTQQINKDQLSVELRKLDPDFGVVSVTTGGKASSDALKEIAEKFPNIAGLVRAYAESLSPATRDEELFEAGKRIGVFHYESEWSLGTPLKMPVALRRTLVPALEKFGKVDANDKSVSMATSPFYGGSGQTNCCAFLTGFMQGFLEAGPFTNNARVQKVACRAKGDLQCTYNVNYDQQA